MAHVFISYVRENLSEVDRLCLALKSAGIQVWLDREQLRPGQRWQDGIRCAIREGAFFLACFSREYLTKERSYMNEELTFAIDELRQRPTNRSWFIPVILNGGDVPNRSIGGGETLRELQWVNLQIDWGKGIAAILSVIHDGEAQREHQPLQSASRVSSRGPTYKVCIGCKGSTTESWHKYSASVGIGEYGGEKTCTVCNGTGQVPASMRPGLFRLRNLVDCWNCERTAIAYNEYHTHCPACGADLFPLATEASAQRMV
jgi:hypothetical protein